MSEDLLSRIRAEIDARLAELRPRVQEITRLEAALAALGKEASSRRAALPKARVRPQPRRTPTHRAPRGANRAAILEAVSARPGASAAELAKVTGIKVTTVRTTLSSLVKAGAVEKDDIGGVRGYHPASA